jgi:hypothetical protein
MPLSPICGIPGTVDPIVMDGERMEPDLASPRLVATAE